MKTICAWCGKIIKDGEPDKDGRVSHGMCAACAAKMNAQIDKRKGK